MTFKEAFENVSKSPKKLTRGYLKNRKPAKKDSLPPGWQYENLANGDRVLLDADQLPAVWNLQPKTELERLAIMKELNPDLSCLIERFNLETSV